MKKISLRLSCIFFILLFAFVSIPFQPVKANTSWDNIIFAIKANLGMVNVANGSLSALDNNDFYASLYETTLAWNNVSFVPADTFNNKAHWVECCNAKGVSDVVGFTDFDIVSCLEQSGYISRSNGGYDFSNIPRLGDNFQNTQSPLDGVEVITNFGDFDSSFSDLKRAPAVTSAYNSIKDYYLNNYDNLVIVKCKTSNSDNFYQYNFVSFENSDFVGFYEYGILYNTYFHNDSFHIVSYTPYLKAYTSISTQSYDNVGKGFAGSYYIPIPNSINFDSSIFNVDSSTLGIYRNNFSVWSNRPVVIGSTTTALQNYYYWLKGSPSGTFYTTANTGNVYTTEYIENNDWSQIYNNYVTDVSNFYSTTENITNENLTQYIDNSTTVTNITNNYITNNNGGGEDDIITNSWLERIYNLLLDFYFAFIGQPSSDSGDNNTFYTDNSVKNDIVNYPLSEFFPDVPSEYFIPENETFSIPLFNQKTARVLQTAMPFCYLEKLKYIASFLSTPPQTPHYEIPFVIDSFGIDETVTISFEDNAWSVLHSVWIALFMIIFIIALFYFTYRFILLVSSILG